MAKGVWLYSPESSCAPVLAACFLSSCGKWGVLVHDETKKSFYLSPDDLHDGEVVGDKEVGSEAVIGDKVVGTCVRPRDVSLDLQHDVESAPALSESAGTIISERSLDA